MKPPVNVLLKDIVKCKHVNSRRTKALAKKSKRCNNRDKTKYEQALKLNAIGEKLSWFSERITQRDRDTPLSPQEFKDLIDLYLKRFDEELEIIKLKQSISKHRAQQHISRENAIKITLEKERNEFNGGGMDFVNLCSTDTYKLFKLWNGSSLSIQHLKMEKISKNILEQHKNEFLKDS